MLLYKALNQFLRKKGPVSGLKKPFPGREIRSGKPLVTTEELFLPEGTAFPREEELSTVDRLTYSFLVFFPQNGARFFMTFSVIKGSDIYIYI